MKGIENSVLNLRTDFTLIVTLSSSIRNNALHDLTLIKMTVARFVGTGNFFIRYYIRHTISISRIKEVLRVCLTKHYFCD
jgi:hypothetical protein